MEKCPRCSSPLERLSLADVTTVTCSNCGYADVPVEHEREFPELESWRDAFNRFYDMVEQDETSDNAGGSAAATETDETREDETDHDSTSDDETPTGDTSNTGTNGDETHDAETAHGDTSDDETPTGDTSNAETDHDSKPDTGTDEENPAETEAGDVADAAAER